MSKVSRPVTTARNGFRTNPIDARTSLARIASNRSDLDSRAILKGVHVAQSRAYEDPPCHNLTEHQIVEPQPWCSFTGPRNRSANDASLFFGKAQGSVCGPLSRRQRV